MRASRLVALLLWLQQHGGAARAADLAAQLEVSLRTIYRDIAALQAAGVPLWTETGPRGGVRLVEGWTTRLDGLSGDEARSLFLAGAGSAATEPGLGALLASAQTKLLATLPADLRGHAGRIRERFLLDAPHWFHRPEPLPCLPMLADAVWTAQRVLITYRRGAETVTRGVDPLGLVLKAGTWYLAARVDDDVRTYRVGRVEQVELTGEHFERPMFDLAGWWSDATAAFSRDILRSRVRVRLSPAAEHLLPHVTDVAAATRALAAGQRDAQGWLCLDLAVESEAVALQHLQALGGGVEVLAPASLRARLAEQARTTLALNA